MKQTMNPKFISICAGVLMFALSLVSNPLLADEYVVGDIELVHPYAPPTPPGVVMAAGYVEIVNHGKEDDRLMGGQVYFADDLQIHQTEVENDVSRMRQLEDGLVIPAGASVKVEPMGIHLMFVGLTKPLVEGDRQSATLMFEKAGEVNFEFVIAHTGSDTMDGMHEGGTMDGMHEGGMHEGGTMDGMHEGGMHDPDSLAHDH